jgi:hypothetical protein
LSISGARLKDRFALAAKLRFSDPLPVRNMVLYGADKAMIVYILHYELYRIMILHNKYNYHSIDITAPAPIILTLSTYFRPQKIQKKSKTYNSRYSLVVTHPTTNLPIYSLNMGERTGSLVLCSLWSYVTVISLFQYLYLLEKWF